MVTTWMMSAKMATQGLLKIKICFSNQWTGFYVLGKLVVKRLKWIVFTAAFEK